MVFHDSDLRRGTSLAQKYEDRNQDQRADH